MSRSRRSQSGHDSKVRQEAKKLERQGFDVSADVLGFPKPKTIGGYRPDILAKKDGARKIVEIETPDSKDNARDKSQQQAFRQAAKRSDNTTFRREIT